MNKWITTLLFAGLIHCYSMAQNVNQAQKVIDTLCSDYYAGRGYVNNGDIKAANYIKDAYKRIGLLPLKGDSYFHNFSLNVNIFPDVVEVTKNGNAMRAGHDFIVSPNSPTYNNDELTLKLLTKSVLLNKKKFKAICKLDWTTHVLAIDTITHDKVSKKRYDKLMKKYDNPLLFITQTKLTWSVSRDQATEVHIQVLPGVVQDNDKVSIDIRAKLMEGYKTRNVLGYIPGTERPDSFIFVTGHYDHLGMMGQDCIMPGANDNASGIAMILDMAAYYKQNPPRYSVVFIGFAGEEAGLVGSYYFVSDLKKYVDPSHIRFVVNMDLMGSGQDGIMAVNGSILPDEYNLLAAINSENNYLPQTKKRGKAANSDHYFFTETGVPAFFFYLMGPYSHYHDVDDTSTNLTLEANSYNGSFNLIRDFIDALMHQDH